MSGRLGGEQDAGMLLGAVRDDIRQTLRTAWIDPSLEACASHAPFFTAAWSVVRPNVGKSFLALARSLRVDAAEAARPHVDAALLERLREARSEEELHRMEESARSAYLIAPKLQIVIHAFHRLLRRERIPGTGREESPVRRGVPEWQRWMAFQPAVDEATPVLDEALVALEAPAVPGTLRLLARWPRALSALWDDVASWAGSEEWRAASARIRRGVLGGINSLPHPMELQWAALTSRGFADASRLALLDVAAAFDQVMAQQTLVAAHVWLSLGAPEVGAEG